LKDRVKAEIGYEVHLEARQEAAGDFRTADFTGLDNFRSSTRLFRYQTDTTVDFLAATPVSLFKGVPAAQNSAPAKYDKLPADERAKDRSVVDKSVRKVMKERRWANFTEEDTTDIEAMLGFVGSDRVLPFDWVVEHYQASAKKKGAELPGSVHASAADFKRLVRDEKFTVGCTVLVLADDTDEDDVSTYWLAKITKHKPETGMLVVQWWHVADGMQGDEDPTERRWQLHVDKDEIHMTTLQAKVTWHWDSKERKEKRKLSKEGAEVLEFWLDKRAKELERAEREEERTRSCDEGDREDEANGFELVNLLGEKEGGTTGKKKKADTPSDERQAEWG
jgi:hypothetical protein